MKKIKRPWAHPVIKKVAPVYLVPGFYQTLQDYARSHGISRHTAYAKMRLGKIATTRLGPKTVLVKL